MGEQRADDRSENANGNHNNHNDLYHWVYVFGTTFLVGLVDFAFFWKENHFIALLILAFWIALISIYELGVRRFTWVFILGFVMLCCSLAGLTHLHWPDIPEDTDREAYLWPSAKPPPSGLCEAKGHLPTGAAKVFLGSNENWVLGSNDTPILTLDERPILTAKVSDGALLFSLDVFDQKHRIIAKIRDDKAVLIPARYSYKVRSDDKSELVLFDEYDREIFRVQVFQSNALIVTGRFVGPDGTSVYVDSHGVHMNIRLDRGVSGNCLIGSRFGLKISKNGLSL